MNSLFHWLTAPEWALAVKALLHSLWQGALIAAGLGLLFRRMADPAARYRLALAGLGAVLLATLVTWGVLNTPQASMSVMAAMPEPAATSPVPSGPVERIVVAANWAPAKAQPQWTAWLALLWLIGASAMLGRASVKVAGAEQLRRRCQPLNDPRITELVAEARRAVRLTRQVRVAVTDQLTSPAVVGVLVPTLILPLSLITTLSPEQIRFVLLHELAHIRRGDYLANLFQLLAEALLFFNPAVWWLSHQIRREREACCDALAIALSGAPADYARPLVSVAETMLQPSPAAAPAFGNDREPSSLSDRIHRVLVPGYRPSLRLTWRAMLAALVLGGALLGLLAAGTRQTIAATATLLAAGKPEGQSAQASLGEGLVAAEPLYQDKPLSYWLERYWVVPTNAPSGGFLEPDPESVAAIRHIGTNSLPTLLSLLQARAASPTSKPFPWDQSRWAQHGFEALGAAASNAVPALIGILDTNHSFTSQEAAAYSLGYIGPAAKPAVPALIRILADTNNYARLSCVRVIGWIHAEPDLGVLALIKSLSDPHSGVRQYAIEALSQYGSDARPAIPALMEILNRQSAESLHAATALGLIGPVAKEAVPVLLQNVSNLKLDAEFRRLCVLALGRIHAGPDSVVPVLIESLDDPRLRYDAIEALGRYGPDAKAAAPLLTKLLQASNPNIRSLATNALKCIESDVGAPITTNAAMTKPESQPPANTPVTSSSAGSTQPSTSDTKPIAATPLSLNPGPNGGWSRGYLAQRLTVSVREDGSYLYQKANVDLADLRSQMAVFAQSISNSTFAVLAHTNAPHGSISNVVKMIEEFGGTANIHPIRPPPFTETDLFTRTFKISAPELARAIGNVGPVAATNTTELARQFFTQVGVDLQLPGRTAFFTEFGQLLFVRATMPELNKVEAFLAGPSRPRQSTNTTPAAVPPGVRNGQPASAQSLDETRASAPNTSTNLLTRTFKISAPELARAMGNVGPVTVTNSTESFRDFFARIGVDLQLPGRTAFFTERSGLLSVRATLSELDKVEAALVAKPTQTGPVSSPPSTSEIRPAGGRRSIVNKLESIRLDSVLMHAVPLDEVARNLTEASRQRDPEKRGIRFLVAGFPSSAPTSQAVNARPPVLFPITIEPELKDVTLQAVLDAVVKGSPVPIRYAIENTAVVFSLSGADQPALLTRTFKVDVNTFCQGLVSVLGIPGLSSSNSAPAKLTNETLRQFFTSVGVDFQPPKSIFFNEKNGMILVRATAADLEVIEQAIQVLNAPVPQVNIRARFVEVPADQVATLLGRITTTTNQGGSFTGILTETQARTLFQSLEQAKGVEILSAPEVTTLSGRPAQVQMVEMKTVVTGVAPIVTNGIITNVLVTAALPFGPVLDVTAHVLADGYTVQLALIPTVTEFLGYEKADATLVDFARTNSSSAALPLPLFRTRQANTTATVWDGQTLVIGGMTAEVRTATRENLPVIGGVPQASLLTREHLRAEKKQLLVFITPTIVDPAGNRANVPADGILLER